MYSTNKNNQSVHQMQQAALGKSHLMHHNKCYYCKYMCIIMLCNQNTTGISTDEQMPAAHSVDGVNILGMMFICIAFGLILGGMENEGKPMLDFFECLHKATVRLIDIVLW